MKNALIKNKLILVCIVFLFACKKKTYDNPKIDKSVIYKSTKKIKPNLSFDVDFSKIGYGRIILPIECTDNDLLMTINLTSREFKKPFIIKRRIGACTMPVNIVLQEEENNKISLLITQIYHPFDDSLVFVKKNNEFKFKEFYNNAYSSSNHRNYIRKGKFKQKGNLIKLNNNIDYP
ncbi:hypothetical protein JI750_12120 [Flavobacterium sp. GN10]|uniref:Lipoprotein n=1 Tax=Flavobacterium tagetis TaxID=2801336 RepID=A0ABS1KEM1_9FLAO|nr:hypothetical protein [Flavobacterium tagetis]MBL0737642.1 hypothetical protein [Flavobacterium tagetis]